MPSARQGGDGLQTLVGGGHLDHDVLADGGQPLALGDHARGIQGGHLAADRPLDHVADLLEQRVGVGAAFLGHQAGVGGHAVAHAHGLDFLDGLEVGRIDEELHGDSPSELTGMAGSVFGIHVAGIHELLRIIDFFEKQTLRRGHAAGGAAAAGGQDPRDVVRRRARRRPISTRVPTMLRTMWCRNRLART